VVGDRGDKWWGEATRERGGGGSGRRGQRERERERERGRAGLVHALWVEAACRVLAGGARAGGTGAGAWGREGMGMVVEVVMREREEMRQGRWLKQEERRRARARARWDEQRWQNGSCPFHLNAFEECGYGGITEEDCNKRGCCYDETSPMRWCYPRATREQWQTFSKSNPRSFKSLRAGPGEQSSEAQEREALEQRQLLLEQKQQQRNLEEKLNRFKKLKHQITKKPQAPSPSTAAEQPPSPPPLPQPSAVPPPPPPPPPVSCRALAAALHAEGIWLDRITPHLLMQMVFRFIASSV
jgi:hypothetical protein